MNLDINNYPGSKGGAGVYQWIINHIPTYTVFYELFGGAGTITYKLLEAYEAQGTILEGIHERHFIVEKSREVFEQHPSSMCEPIVVHGCGIQTLRDLIEADRRSVVVYLDPPYLKESRRAKENARDIYHIMWSIDDHIEMLSLATIAKFAIIISGYDHPLYNEMLKDWHTSEFQAMTRSGPMTEKIWMNYDISELELACTEYVGRDYIDRQRINRRKKAFARRFQKMPLHERQAILQHIQQSLGQLPQ